MTKQIQVYEVVLDEIKRRVADGILQPGERLPSNQKLSEEFNVGVSSIREALRVLAATGIVRIERGSGVYVSPQPPPPEELRERFTSTEVASLSHLMEARLILEPEIAALAAERATPTQVKRLQSLAERMDRYFRSGRDWMEADLGFHKTLYEAAGNPVIEAMLRQANDLLVNSRRQTMRDNPISERACYYHLLIASAVAEHKPILARALMHEHMQDAVAIFSRLYPKNELASDQNRSADGRV